MAGPTRFVTDSSLELLARRLRFLGFDVITHRGARLEELFAAAAPEGRTVLTLSARRPREHASVPVERVPRDPATALRIVVGAHEPAGPPWSRCPVCNVPLHSRSAFEARGEVPGRIARAGLPFRWCPSCARWFWPGSHVTRMSRWLSEALGREVGPA